MQILSKLIQLLPLCKQDAQERLQSLMGDKVAQGIEFLGMFTQKKMQTESLPLLIAPETELRDYQRQGIQWMRQLGRYGLNCCLCDEMGLGKTIQSLSVVINESVVLKQQHHVHPVSLVICPNTLTYQWKKEVEKFFGAHKIRTATYPSQTDVFGLAQQGKLDIIITSYEKARSDIHLFQQLHFFYLVLDEGHRIKNAKTKVTQAVKAISAERKLLLSGTPLQNKVCELWSIFDFLMPNFLENEKVFNSRYNQFLTSNLNKLSEKLEETEKFIQALKSLKKRVAPFILRRTKEQVLKDLPPKVIQDFECQMPPVQREVHDFIENHYPISQLVTRSTADDPSNNDGQPKEKLAGSSILQNLILHRKVCNHPVFVQDACSHAMKAVFSDLNKQMARSNDAVVEHSGKLVGLLDLLRQSEIIESQEDNNGEPESKKASRKATQEREYEGLLEIQDADD